jgi:hypothetical protein
MLFEENLLQQNNNQSFQKVDGKVAVSANIETSTNSGSKQRYLKYMQIVWKHCSKRRQNWNKTKGSCGEQ